MARRHRVEAAGVLLFIAMAWAGSGAGAGPPASKAPEADVNLWSDAQGYEVTITGATEEFGRVYRSKDFQKLLVLPDKGDDAYYLTLIEKGVATLPRTAVAVSEDGARLAPDVKLTPRGTFTRREADILFQVGGVSVVLGPQPPLVGKVTLEQVLARKKEYVTAARAYTPDSLAVSVLKRSARPAQIVVFFGTWCQSCRHWMPIFIKTMQLAANPRITVQYVAVDENYSGPRDLLEKYNVHITPTFIVMAGSRELGRIKGKPALTVEKDLVEILGRQK